MNIRFFSDSRSFVSSQDLPVLNTPNGISLPLNRESIDRNSIRIHNISSEPYILRKPIGTVIKGSNRYNGNITEVTEDRATLISNGVRVTIRDYDQIQDPLYLSMNIGNQNPSSLTASYITSDITGEVVHNLSLSKDHLKTELIVQNSGFVDIVDSSLEVVTSEEPMYRAVSFQMSVADTMTETSSGTIYTVDGTYSIPSGYQLAVPLINTPVETDELYIIDAPNGTNNATYTLLWSSPVELPSGSMYIYQDDSLEATTSISSMASGQVSELPILTVSSVYARGTISMQTVGQDTNITEYTLSGIIRNTLSDTIDVRLRYQIGDGTVLFNGQIPDNVRKQGIYLIASYSMNADSTQPYNISFRVRR